MNDLISIIIPVYNKEKYIESTLLSCKNQTYTNIEIIIIDDGSVDNSGSICKRFAEDDYRFSYYYQENKGASFSRNRGLRISQGKWIVFLDADDFLTSDFCELCLKKAIQFDSDIVIVSSREKDDNGSENIVRISNEEQIIWKNKDVKKLELLIAVGEYDGLKYNYTLDGPCCKIIRKSVIEKAYFPDNLNLGEDTCFIAQVINNARVVVFYNSQLYIRNIVSNSLSFSRNINKVDRVVDYVCWLLDYWENILPGSILKRFIVRVYSVTLFEYLSYDEISLKERKTIIKNAFKRIPIHFWYYIYMKPKELVYSFVYLLNSEKVLRLLLAIKKKVHL